MERRGDLKPLSVRTELTAVASFFSRIGLPLALKRGDWESTQQQQVIQRLKVTRDDVKAMYAHANLRDRALLLVLALINKGRIEQSDISAVITAQMQDKITNEDANRIVDIIKEYPSIYPSFDAEMERRHRNYEEFRKSYRK